MIRIAVTMAFVGLCCGCGHGLTGPLPIVNSLDQGSGIYLIRGYGMGAISAYVSFDDNDVLAIRQGEYTKFPVPAGKHKIGVKYPGFRPNRIPVRLAPKREYYFRIITVFDNFYIMPITKDQAEALIAAECRFLPLDNSAGLGKPIEGGGR